MEYVTLGKTGLRISRLGFGGIPIQRVSEGEAKTLLEAVREAGINYIDSARGYTVSEALIGKAIEGHRDEFVIATKSMARDRETMAKDIDISLGNFRTDHIDLYQVHNPTVAQLEQVAAPGGALEALMEAKAAGKVRHLGVTAHSLEVFQRALELDWVETIMFPYNIVENQGEELMARAKEQNVGFVDMKPLAGGAIEDSELALRYIKANPNVTLVIPGMYSPEEVTKNAAAMEDDRPLSVEDQAKMEQIRKDLGTQFCRRCNYCAPCTVGISIPNAFLFQGYLRRYGLAGWAKDRYSGMTAKAGDCVECGECESRCPYQLPIREMMKKVAQDFGA
jgi:predicted aldo/keto reductase-like oxidoreductase